MKLNHSGTLTLCTQRLILRQFQMHDAGSMLRNWIADKTIQNNYGEPVYETEEAVLELLLLWESCYKNKDFYRWAIIHKESTENIGQIAFCKVYSDIGVAEIEYCIGQRYWGNGYANESLDAVIQYAFKHPRFFKIEAFHRNENINSSRVLQKSAMVVVPTVERFVRENKKAHNETCYAIFNPDNA